ncbi:MAG: flagellar motor protein MotA [Hydrogenophilales bacterium 16-64-46]|nr:MAG: flagellar motor protein MotA [Hydrogenophilales bacterium 12-64-13]OYZ03981.1 MAG: flagellar motor protein MotA [Hydrogenophilales bacterium 16-64-46]OZA39018.1 MAG: flagellar motor protein MotA [Hydrogenophilales bacterium 17-64-34]HQT01191.1 MotA/TolQ/ExbB proton channel family protein [Thiobacillus sp.]
MSTFTESFAVNLTLAVLLVFSIVTWMLILARVWQSVRDARRDAAFKQAFWAAKDLHAGEAIARAQPGDLAALTVAGFEAISEDKEAPLSLDSLGDRKDILERTLKSQLQQIQHRKEYGLMALASIGSTAPFVGLFGTVWGIMHALQNISLSNSASLNIVAGPVGEALAATAFGIATAIPAVLAYNYGVRRVRTTVAGIDQFATDFLHLVMKSPYRAEKKADGKKDEGK